MKWRWKDPRTPKGGMLYAKYCRSARIAYDFFVWILAPVFDTRQVSFRTISVSPPRA